MMVLNNSMNSQNSSGSSPSLSRSFLILEKLKAAQAQQQAKLKNDQLKQTSEKSTKKLPHKRVLKPRDHNSLSSSSPESKLELKRTTIQEKLFERQCKELKHKNLDKSLDSNTLTSNFNSCTPDDNDADKTIMAGVLHLKEPLGNTKNESLYYESRGRMESMDWSVLDGDKRTTQDGKNFDSVQSKKEETLNKINKFSETKPAANGEFVSFVKNYISPKTIYEVNGNLEQIQNYIDSPILKLQRIVKNNNKNALLVTQEILQTFEASQSKIHVIDLIDSPIKLAAVSNGKSKLDETSKVKENSEASKLEQPQDDVMNGSKDLCEFESRDSLSTLTMQNSHLTNGKKKAIDEFDDDMFNFAKPASETTSSVCLTDTDGNEKATLNNTTDFANSDFKTNSPRRFANSNNNGLATLSNSDSASPALNSYLNKLKNLGNVKLNYSVDSDDMSLGTDTELHDESDLRKSTTSNYETFRKKLKNASTQYSPKYNQKQNTDANNINFEQKNSSREVESPKNEFLMKEIHTRYFENINSNPFEFETNVVEVSNIKIAPIEEPLLKAVSTRYFPKPLKIGENVVDIKKDECKLEEINEVMSGKIDTLDIVYADIKDSQPLNIVAINDLKNSKKNQCNQYSNVHPGNNSTNESSAIIKKENYIIDTSRQTILSEIDDSEDGAIKSSVIIQEIDSDSENDKNHENLVQSDAREVKDKVPSPDSTSQDCSTFYDSIDSDEEFDIVNLEKLTPYTNLLNKLLWVKAAQKAMTTGMVDTDDLKFVGNVQPYDNFSNVQTNALTNSKSDESSFEIFENHNSSINARISSNLETDTKASSNSTGSPNSLFNAKSNIFGNVQINGNQLNNCIHDYYDSTPKPKNITTPKNSNTEMSKRMKKMTSALKNHQKNLKAKDTEEVKKEIQQPVNTKLNESPKTDVLSSRKKILNHIKKRQMQLNSK